VQSKLTFNTELRVMQNLYEVHGAPTALRPGGQQKPLPALAPSTYHNANAYTLPSATEQPLAHRGSMASDVNDKTMDDPRQSFFQSQQDLIQNMPMQPRSVRRGIWLPEDRRAFQEQSLLSQIFRCLVCFLVLGVILVLSIIILIVLFLRPPNIGVKNIDMPQSIDGLNIDPSRQAFSFPINLTVRVSNPNYVSAEINSIHANLFDKHADSTRVGSCDLRHKHIKSHNDTDITIPCHVRYSLEEDPNKSVIKDIINRCGFNGKKKQDFDMSLKLRLSITVLSITVPINVNPNIRFSCPVSKSDLKKIGGSSPLMKVIDQLTRRDTETLFSRETPFWLLDLDSSVEHDGL